MFLIKFQAFSKPGRVKYKIQGFPVSVENPVIYNVDIRLEFLTFSLMSGKLLYIIYVTEVLNILPNKVRKVVMTMGYTTESRQQSIALVHLFKIYYILCFYRQLTARYVYCMLHKS